jgi:hypothetical protein
MEYLINNVSCNNEMKLFSSYLIMTIKRSLVKLAGMAIVPSASGKCFFFVESLVHTISSKVSFCNRMYLKNLAWCFLRSLHNW